LFNYAYPEGSAKRSFSETMTQILPVVLLLSLRNLHLRLVLRKKIERSCEEVSWGGGL